MAQGIKGSSPVCLIEGCERVSRGHGRCDRHYQTWKKWGSDTRPDPTRSVGDRLDEKVVAGDPSTWRPDLGPCLIWTGYVGTHGYGVIRDENGRDDLVHRVNYRRFKGAIPDGYEVDHLCFTLPCCNPDHLEAVTPDENKRRSADRTTHCPRGHPYNEENTYVCKRGYRSCRTCKRERDAERRAARMG